eukprot:SAG31_NODE_45521_length_258_cov_0.981132_1_plen_24_part_01
MLQVAATRVYDTPVKTLSFGFRPI